MSVRRATSRDAIERALRAHLAVDLGVSSDDLALPIVIVAQPATADGLDWRLDLSGVADASRPALQAAEAAVAARLKLG